MAELSFVYGAMNSSKSASLIMKWFNLTQDDKNVIVFKPSTDTRSSGYVESRAVGTKVEAIEILNEGEILYHIHKELFLEKKISYVLVDEVQFLNKAQIEELSDVVDLYDINVICYGLATNFKGNMFEGSKRLFELCDNLIRVESDCTMCENGGIMNARYIDGKFEIEGKETLIGKEDSYKVLCRKCYKKQRKLKELTEGKNNK